MDTATPKPQDGVTDRDLVRMYPDNRLPQPVRELADTLSIFSVVKGAFEGRA